MPLHACCRRRVRYEQTLADLRAAVAAKLGVPPEHQLLFRHGRQLAPEDDGKTLLLLDMHTGFALQGYDTVSSALPPAPAAPAAWSALHSAHVWATQEH